MKVTRFTQTNRCPICGGWEKARRGRGERCYGYLSDNRRFAHCTREERAGGLPLGSQSSAYRHLLVGDCRCGVRHDGIPHSVPNRAGRTSRKRAHSAEAQRIVGTYDYRQRDGTLLFQVVRRDPKGFSQRRPDGAGGWVWNLQGINPVLYRLPELLSGNPKESVFVVEGEKDADKLANVGMMSTTSPMGAGKWRPEYGDALRGRDVVLLPDNDRQGHEHMESVALSLVGVASSIKLVNLPDLAAKGDVSDWLAAGGTVDELNQLVSQTQEYKQRTQLVISAGSDSDKGTVQPEVMPFHHHLTDLGNAQRFVELHGRDLRFSHERNKWFVWGGTRWAVDMDGQVERRAKETTISIYDEAASEEDADLRARLGKWAAASESRGRISAMIELAKTEPGIPILTASFDADPFLLNCRNGTINLQTGQLQEHRREDFCTKLVRVEYEPTATCPLFEAVLDRIMGGNTQLTSFMQRAVGYFLTGSTKEQVIFIWQGGGANGKTTLIETVRSLLGDYGMTADPSLLLARKDDGVRNDVARLAGARFVSTVETPAGKRLAETLVKLLTGGDKIAARFLYSEFFEFTAQLKLVLATNYRPRILGNDKGIWRRIRLVPFNVTVPEQDQDKDLLRKLRLELPGILAWAVRGCLTWQEQGLGVPPEVGEATESYRQEMDELGAFLAECCVEKPSAKVPVRDLYKAYTTWCDENGVQPLTKRALGIQLTDRGFVPDRDKNARLRVGLGLMTQMTHDDAIFGKLPDNHPQEGLFPKPMSSASSTSPNVVTDSVDMEEVDL